MDFGLTDDQRQIQRTARELLTERARPERVREHAEAAGASKAAARSRLQKRGRRGGVDDVERHRGHRLAGGSGVHTTRRHAGRPPLPDDPG